MYTYMYVYICIYIHIYIFLFVVHYVSYMPHDLSPWANIRWHMHCCETTTHAKELHTLCFKLNCGVERLAQKLN